MEKGTLTRPFIMEVNGKFVVNPPKSLEDDEYVNPSRLGARTDAAVLKLTDGYLNSGEYYMGRLQLEPRAYMPMGVFWTKWKDTVQPCQCHGSEENPELKMNGSIIGTTENEDEVFALLHESMGSSDVKLHYQ